MRLGLAMDMVGDSAITLRETRSVELSSRFKIAQLVLCTPDDLHKAYPCVDSRNIIRRSPCRWEHGTALLDDLLPNIGDSPNQGFCSLTFLDQALNSG